MASLLGARTLLGTNGVDTCSSDALLVRGSASQPQQGPPQGCSTFLCSESKPVERQNKHMLQKLVNEDLYIWRSLIQVAKI